MSSKWVLMCDTVGSTIASVLHMDDAVYVRFTDDTYVRLKATYDGSCDWCDDSIEAYIEEVEPKDMSPHEAQVMRNLKILDETDYQEAMDAYNAKLKAVAAKDEENERATLARLIKKYGVPQ